MTEDEKFIDSIFGSWTTFSESLKKCIEYGEKKEHKRWSDLMTTLEPSMCKNYLSINLDKIIEIINDSMIDSGGYMYVSEYFSKDKFKFELKKGGPDMTNNNEIYFRSADTNTGQRDRVTRPKNKKLAVILLKKEWIISAIAEWCGYNESQVKAMGRGLLFNYTWEGAENRFLNNEG